MKTLLVTLISGFCFFGIHSASATELTPENIENLKNRLKSLKENLDTHLTSRNTNAADIFARASADPRAAIELYTKCVQEVLFEREERRESEFREWKDNNSDRFRDPRFAESLQIQLRYLSLSCQAAEAESLDKVFNSLMSFVEGLSQMQELPTAALTQSSAGSVFAEAYNLEELLGSNERWEPVPFSIAGIYEKSILPYLRENNASALMNAWDKRTEQQTRLAQTLNTLIGEQERTIRNNGGNPRGALGDLARGDRSQMIQSHDKDDFVRETLPLLQWGKLRDQFYYVDEVAAASAMLKFVEEHLTHDLGERFYAEFEDIISDAGVGSNRIEEATTDSN